MPEKFDEQLLQQIFEVFGRRQKPGEPPLESLPPSLRINPAAPLNEQERDALLWADCRFLGIKPAPKDDPIYRSGSSVRCVVSSQRNEAEASESSQAGESSIESVPDTPVNHDSTYESQPMQIPFSHSNIPRITITSWDQLYLNYAIVFLKNGDISGIRKVLADAKNDNLNWETIFRKAVAMRRTSWPPAPQLSDVAPAPTGLSECGGPRHEPR